MENKNAYNHLTADDKHYFGGFLNLAQNNIDGIFREFCDRLNLKYEPGKHKDIINGFFKDKASYTDWEYGVLILKEYLPVISIIDIPLSNKRIEVLAEKKEYKGKSKEEIKRAYFRKTFCMLLTAVNDLRNYYTHYYHARIALDEGLFFFLDEALLHTVKDVRNNKMKADKTRQLLKKSLTAELEKLCALRKEELKEKKKLQPKVNLNDSAGIENAVLNRAFSPLLYKDKESDREALSKYFSARLPEEMQHEAGVPISISGLIFLLSMFLRRKEVEQFMSNIERFKIRQIEIEEVSEKQNTLRIIALRWVFSTMAFKGVKRRITSTFEKETLMMQMIDELNKVPDEVYQTLSDKNKDQFIEDINEYVSETNKENEDPLYVIHPVIRKRYENKFNYFAIRFLDEYAQFPTLRFQVFAGQYLHDKREKKIAGIKLLSERLVKEKINVFGKLSDVVQKKNDYFKTHQTLKDECWELFPNPSYNFATNNIYVYIDLFRHGERAKEVQVHINRLSKNLNKDRTQRISKEQIIKIVFDGLEVNRHPTLQLSMHELMSILYEFLVKKRTGEEIEKRIVEKIVEKYDLLMGYDSKQTDVSKKELPKKLLKSEPGNDQIDYAKLQRAIEQEIKNGEEKLKLIRDNQEKAEVKKEKRKFVFYSKEKGREATWIANDLKKFMPVFTRTNWKGIQHSELQKLIAYYDTEYDQVKTLLGSVWDIHTDADKGKILFEAFNERVFEQFYIRYINQRNKVLNVFLTTIRHNLNEPRALKKVLKDVFTVFDKRLYQINSTNKQKDALLTKPFALSRGIFDDKPTVVPGHRPQDNPGLFADWYVYGYHYNGAFQAFYETAREYGQWYTKKKEEGALPAFSGKDEAYKMQRFRKDCDLNIKRIKFQDVYTKLMVDFLFEKTFNGEKLLFDLSKLYESREQRLANQLKALQQKDRPEGDISENIRNENYIWNKAVDITLLDGRIVEKNIKLKDLGKFRRFVTDQKVEALLSYDTKTWSKQNLEDELENDKDCYEAIRRKVLLMHIQQFEKVILEKGGFDGKNHPEDFMVKGSPNFRMYIINGVLRRIGGISEGDLQLLNDMPFEKITIKEVEKMNELSQKAYLLIYLRNKFGHNQLPDKERYDLMRKLYPDCIISTFSSFFNKVTMLIIEELKMLI